MFGVPEDSLFWCKTFGCTTRSLVAWSPAGLLWQTKAPKLLSDWTSASISEKVNISWGQRSIDAITCVDLHLLVSSSINMLSVTDFDPKGIISGVRVQAGVYLDMLDADRSPNAVSVDAGTSQVDFEVDHPPPALPGHLLITMVKEAVFCTKKMSFEKWKKSRISHWSESDENSKWLRDCPWLCQACKRGFTFRPMERNPRQEAHSYPQANICSAPLQLPAWHTYI